MIKIISIFIVIASALAAEIPSHATLDKQDDLKPDVPEAIETHAVYKKPLKPELEHHPVYRAEERKNQGRARIEPVRAHGPVVKHDMLADEPVSSDVNKADNYGFSNPVEVAYPDIPYAPEYGYGNGFTGPNGYDLYNPSEYYMEPDTSATGLLWSQVPDSRTLVSLAGRIIHFIFSSIFVIMLGSLLTVGVCSYTNLCSITFNGVGPIHEEMRSLITPERLDRIGKAADFVKTAINRYQKIQNIAEPGTRKRRSPLF
ncbi:uncharacterized protein LOC128198006 [Bicyclus anynana]|uniref:Uncharacterized protein LOC128198006 n=1 Tax=Bicyclus anynana TaxID=110368 RepID=A0ABM3LKX5_BICAN|nr:uncharacterized protein LOC128198006 [Bicyclus anynana]